METRRRCIVGTAVCGLSLALAAALYACAPQAAPQEGKADGGKAAQTEPVAIDWSPTADCAVCHVTEAESATDAACDASQHADMTCIECHTDESQLATMHEGKTTGDRMPMRLKKTTVDKSLCTPCHDQATIAAASADCTVLTDVNGKTVNPHELAWRQIARRDNVQRLSRDAQRRDGAHRRCPEAVPHVPSLGRVRVLHLSRTRLIVQANNTGHKERMRHD